MVFTLKVRKNAIFGAIRKHLGEVFHDAPEQKGCQIVEGLDEALRWFANKSGIGRTRMHIVNSSDLACDGRFLAAQVFAPLRG